MLSIKMSFPRVTDKCSTQFPTPTQGNEFNCIQYPSNIAGGSFPGIKLPRREANHSPPSSAEVKNAWSYTCTAPIRLHGMVLS